jgi:hypothetical protein
MKTDDSIGETEFLSNATLLRTNCDSPIVGFHIRRLLQRRWTVAVDKEQISFCAPVLCPLLLTFATSFLLSLSVAVRDSEPLFYFVAVLFAIAMFQRRPFHLVFPRSAVLSLDYVSRSSLFGTCEVARIQMSDYCLDVTTDAPVTF